MVKENDERKKKQAENERRKQKKENFVKKFFLDSSNSQVGTFRLDGGNSTGARSVGKTDGEAI